MWNNSINLKQDFINLIWEHVFSRDLHYTFYLSTIISGALELCVLLFIVFFISSDALQSPKLSARHEQQRVILSYVLKITKKTAIFPLLGQENNLDKEKLSAVHFPSWNALYKLNLCIVCQSPGLWAESRLPWIFIFYKVNLLKLFLRAISEWIKREISAEDRQFQKRWETEYLKTSMCVSSTIRPLNLMMRHFTQRCGLSRFYETEKKSPRERQSVMWPGFYVSQFTALETTQMRYTSWLCMMLWKPCMWKPFAGKPNATWKLYSASILSACSECAHHHNSLPSRMRNSIFTFFTHSFAADVESLSDYWREVLNEIHFRARVFSFHPLHDATAPPMRWDYLGGTYLWEQMFSVIRIKGSWHTYCRSSCKRQNILWAGVQG